MASKRGRKNTDPLAHVGSTSLQGDELEEASLDQKCSRLRAALVHAHELRGYLPLLLLDTTHSPINSLRSLFSRGLPLCILWNLLPGQANVELDVLQEMPAEIARRHAFSMFLVKMQTLEGQLGDVSLQEILDMTDTSVLERLVDAILDLLTQVPSALASPSRPLVSRQRSSDEVSWDSTVTALLAAEHRFVQSLQTMRVYAKALSEHKILEADILGHIFPHSLFVFHRKFLVMLENTAQSPRAEQRWSEHFLKKKEDFGVIYNLYIVNSTLAKTDLMLADTKLCELGFQQPNGLSLTKVLLTPLQHLADYCRFIESLKALSLGCIPLRPHYNELATAFSVMQSLVKRVKDAQKSVKLDQVTSDLRNRVKDWGHHRIDDFGRLLMHDMMHLTVGHTDVEHCVYLFERVLLYCIEVPDSPPASRRRLGSFSFRPRALSDSDSRKSTKMYLQIQGCLFIREIEDVLAVESNASSGLIYQRKLLLSHRGKHLRFLCQTLEQLKEWEVEIRNLTHSGPSTRRIALRLSSFPLPSTVKVKLHIDGEIYATVVSRGISYDALCRALVRKWILVTSRHSSDIKPNDYESDANLPPISLTYQDENNLMVSIVSTRDVDAAFGASDTVNLFAAFVG